MGEKDPLADCSGFDWDDAHVAKNWEFHRVTPEEAEDSFFNHPFVLRWDSGHSKFEKRYFALGKTTIGRRLFVAFTIRRNLVRVISARDMSRRESEEYEHHEKRDSQV